MMCMTADRLCVPRPVSCQNDFSLLNRTCDRRRVRSRTPTAALVKALTLTITLTLTLTLNPGWH